MVFLYWIIGGALAVCSDSTFQCKLSIEFSPFLSPKILCRKQQRRVHLLRLRLFCQNTTDTQHKTQALSCKNNRKQDIGLLALFNPEVFSVTCLCRISVCFNHTYLSKALSTCLPNYLSRHGLMLTPRAAGQTTISDVT